MVPLIQKHLMLASFFCNVKCMTVTEIIHMAPTPSPSTRAISKIVSLLVTYAQKHWHSSTWTLFPKVLSMLLFLWRGQSVFDSADLRRSYIKSDAILARFLIRSI